MYGNYDINFSFYLDKSAEILNKLGNVYLGAGRTTVIPCIAIGAPPPTIKWLQNGTVITAVSCCSTLISIDNLSFLVGAICFAVIKSIY